MPNNENITQGVQCVVNSCQFYKQGDKCTAGQIKITPKNATNSDETDCSTFTPQEGLQ